MNFVNIDSQVFLIFCMILFQKRVGIIDPKNNAEWFNRKENAKPPFGRRCVVEHANQKQPVPTYGATKSVEC